MSGRRGRPSLLARELATILAGALVFVVACDAAGPARGRSAQVVCRLVASPHGRDRNRGTLARPFRTIQRLADALRPGETGCLRAGTYVENPDLFRGGLPHRRLRIRSYPGERARLDGTLWITRSARYVTVQDLTVCGAPGGGACRGKRFSSGESSAVQVSAGHAILIGDEISNPAGICVILGTAPRDSGRDGPGDRATIAYTAVHNCGTPGGSNMIEGVYDEFSLGSVIEHDHIYDNSAQGIQLYPAARYTTIEHNVLWGNGEGVLFGGSDQLASSHNLLAYNVIGDSVTRWNIESSWPGPVGVGNVAYDNCLYAHNPLQGGYYNQDSGVEPASSGGTGFISIGEHRWPRCPRSASGSPLGR